MHCHRNRGIAHATQGFNQATLFAGYNTGWTAAHEFGHIMGLDQAKPFEMNAPDSNGVSNPNIMGTHFGVPDQDDIDVIRGNFP